MFTPVISCPALCIFAKRGGLSLNGCFFSLRDSPRFSTILTFQHFFFRFIFMARACVAFSHPLWFTLAHTCVALSQSLWFTFAHVCVAFSHPLWFTFAHACVTFSHPLLFTLAYAYAIVHVSRFPTFYGLHLLMHARLCMCCVFLPTVIYTCPSMRGCACVTSHQLWFTLAHAHAVMHVLCCPTHCGLHLLMHM